MADPDTAPPDNADPDNTGTRIAIIGTGAIGASWAAAFLARGFTVTATDPAPGAEAAARAAIAGHWPALAMLGVAAGAAPENLRWAPDLAGCVEGADLVLENGPERLDFKRAIFAELDAIAPAQTVLASSSSTLMPSEFQQDCTRHPGRVILAHPFHPPHLIPLVEVVGGAQCDEAAIARAMEILRRAGKKPIRLGREIRGHIANRLQAALWQEAYHLVEQGVASVADIDTAIAHGPGLRWALLGPFLTQHLSGGAAGLAHVLAHLGPPTETMWRDLGEVHLTPALIDRLVAGVADELADRRHDELVAARDALLQTLVRLKSAQTLLP